jgi:hypothetical protein
MSALDSYDLAKRKSARERKAEQREEKWVLTRAEPDDKHGRSPALSFVGMVWNLAQQETGHSWQRFNSGLRGALMLAVETGMVFHDDDFTYMVEQWRAGFWLGADNAYSLGESIYAKAIEYRNFQACRSFEKWRGREPFIFDGDRLAHNSEMPLPGQGRWKVTSFSEDGKAINLCMYQWVGDGDKRDYKPTRRRKLTLEQVRAMSRAVEHSRKEPEKVFCVGCGEHRESEGRCKCGSTEGVRDGRLGPLTTDSKKLGNKDRPKPHEPTAASG